jgi:hypothetical protein
MKFALEFATENIEIVARNQFRHDEFPCGLGMRFGLILRYSRVPEPLRVPKTIGEGHPQRSPGVPAFGNISARSARRNQGC